MADVFPVTRIHIHIHAYAQVCYHFTKGGTYITNTLSESIVLHNVTYLLSLHPSLSLPLRLLVALSLSLLLTVLELLGFLSGLSMFVALPSMFCKYIYERMTLVLATLVMSHLTS